MRLASTNGTNSRTRKPVFSALRAYVLSRSKLLGTLVFLLSMAPVAANLVSQTI